MTCPHGLRPTLPGLCRHGSAALGVFPGAPPPPAPPLGSKGSFLKPPPIAADRPQGCALAPGPQVSPPPDATHACKTRGGPPMGWPPCRQPNSPHLIQAGVPLAQGQIASPAPPSKMSTLLCSPLLLAKGPTCPPSSETCLGWQFSPALSLPPTPSSMSSSSDYGGYRV